MQKHAHLCTNIQRSNDIDESNEGLKRVVRTSFMTRELHTKASMTRIKKISVVLCAFAALCGCWPQENPDRIYTIVLDNGKIQRILKIPGGYIEVKDEKLRPKEGVGVGFLFSNLKPYILNTPNEDGVWVFIELISDPNRMSMSDSFLNTIKARMKMPPDKNSARDLGKSGVYDVYEDTDLQTHSIAPITSNRT